MSYARRLQRLQHSESVAFPCVDCGALCIADPKGGSEGQGCVMHPEPICPTFDRLDPLEFVELTNRTFREQERKNAN